MPKICYISIKILVLWKTTPKIIAPSLSKPHLLVCLLSVFTTPDCYDTDPKTVGILFKYIISYAYCNVVKVKQDWRIEKCPRPLPNKHVEIL